MTHITIRRIETSDAKAISEIYTHTNAYTGTLQMPHPSLPQWEKRFANIPDHVYAYAAIIDGEIVGNLSVTLATNPRRRHVADMGIGVKDAFQGQGIGNELMKTAVDLADNWLNLTRLELTVFTDNAAAIALYQKHGFIIEGEARAFAFRNGEYADAYFMARIK